MLNEYIGDGRENKEFNFIHFNDVYNINAKQENIIKP